MNGAERPLPDSSFVVLALLAEGEAHGYDIAKMAHTRGFHFWTRLRRSAVYNALVALEKAGLIAARVSPGDGPDRKIYRLTGNGRRRLRGDGLLHLSQPAHPRSEIDLGIYVLPFLPRAAARRAFAASLAHLRRRADFLRERLDWCRSEGMTLPALAFERPLLALAAEITWLERLAEAYEAGLTIGARDWARYVYRDPREPRLDEDTEPPRTQRRRRGV